jgi:3-dehydroquinate dehydratase/shikimate dehydrogenase
MADSFLPLVCAAVTGATSAELVRARDAARRADLVEVRLDTAVDPDPEAVVANRTRPVLVTCRAAWEGGYFRGAEEERERLLIRALDAGADFVDVEWVAPCRDRVLARDPGRTVVSAHDFQGVPRDLSDRVRAMRASGAGVTKVAVMASRLSDQLPLFDLARPATPGGPRHVLLAMGEAGVCTRVLAARLGNAWTYAGEGVAPGQPSVDRLLDVFRFRELSAAPRLFGVVGKPVAHSLSPDMHNAAFGGLGMDAAYLPLAAADFADFETFCTALAIEGVSVTAPFKRDALDYAAEHDPVARRVAAANTLRRRADGAWAARNTDVEGFLAPLAGVPLERRRVTVVGAGGAARAVIVGLLERGALVTLSGRRSDAVDALAREFGVEAGPFPPAPGSWNALVHTTPAGTWPDVEALPVPAESLHGGLVYDLVYNPPLTALMRAARERGATVIGGLDMLVGQAVRQFEWWTGRLPDAALMRAAAERALQRLAARDGRDAAAPAATPAVE